MERKSYHVIEYRNGGGPTFIRSRSHGRGWYLTSAGSLESIPTLKMVEHQLTLGFPVGASVVMFADEQSSVVSPGKLSAQNDIASVIMHHD